MIGIVGGCISYSMTNYTLPLQLSSAFFHGLWTWFIAFCLADVFNLLQDNEEDSGRQIEVTLKLEDTLPAFYVGLHTPHHDKRSCPHGNFFSIYPTSYSLKYINDFSNISIVSPLISTIFSLYRRFDTRYRFTDNLRHSKRTTYPIHQAIYCRTLRLKR